MIPPLICIYPGSICLHACPQCPSGEQSCLYLKNKSFFSPPFLHPEYGNQPFFLGCGISCFALRLARNRFHLRSLAFFAVTPICLALSLMQLSQRKDYMICISYEL